MRRIWSAFKLLAPTVPFMFLRNYQMAEEEEDLTPEI